MDINLINIFVRYFALFLLLVMGMYLVVSLIASADTIINGVNEKAKANKLEDGEFEVFERLSKGELSELKDKDIEVEEAFYMDYKLKDKSTIRIYKNRKKINLIDLDEGKLASSENEIVMEKTLRGKIVKLYEEDEEILEDAITENRQAIEMAQIYSNILNGTMDAYASIISNNLNGVMKFLTSITIILAVPTMISSFWGMNVKLPFENSPMGFLIMVLIAIIMTIAVTLWLNKKDMIK